MLIFFVSLIICIVLHEFGHLFAAKLCKCGVESYSIGFGKPIFKRVYKNTEYRIAPWLFGGYCTLEGELENRKSKTAFTSLSYRKKAFITSAGCAVNIFTGLIVGIIGHYICNFNLLYFSTVSVLLGITNLLPLAPCLDGGYLIFYPIFIKTMGKKRGTKAFAKAVKISFKIIMFLNILCIPWIIANWRAFSYIM